MTHVFSHLWFLGTNLRCEHTTYSNHISQVECSYCPSSKKPHFTAHGDQHWKPQPGHNEEITEFWKAQLQQIYLYHTAPASVPQGTAQYLCGGFNVNASHSFTCLNTWSHWWNCLGNMRRCGLGGRCMPPHHPQHFLCLLLEGQYMSSYLLLQHHSCLPDVMFPSTMAMDSYLSGIIIPK